jgi:hypothetical protein
VFVVFETDATKLALKPAFTVTDCGDKLRPIGCGVTVTVAEADLLLSPVDVAVTVTAADVDTSDGATNKPVESMVPALAVQVTGNALLAMNC